MGKRSKIKWIINALRFFTQRISNNKRKKNIWAFAAWEGEKYSDNSKYLYEYTKNNFKKIRCIWFTSNKNVFEKLSKRKDEVYLIGTEESRKMQLKAGVAFFTNGLDDFGENPYIYGAYLVSLWHGVSFKRIYGSDESKYSNKYLKLLKKVKSKIFDFAYRDLSITTSSYMQLKVAEQFYINDLNKIVIGGQPRNDAFCIHSNLNIEELDNYKLITYMPTYQSFNNQNELNDIIEFLDNDIELNKFLKENGYKIVLKLHYLAKIRNVKYKNLVMIRDDRISDVQQLLAATSLLITDYSSVFSDFALTNRPIIFFRPNDNSYLKIAGLYDEFSEVCSYNLAQNTSELVEMLTNIISNKIDYQKQNEIINSFFSDERIKLGDCSKTVANIVISKISENGD